MDPIEYTFQSPYPSPFQVGRIDLTSVKDNTQKNVIPQENKVEQDSAITSMVSSEEQLQELQIMDDSSSMLPLTPPGVSPLAPPAISPLELPVVSSFMEPVVSPFILDTYA